MNRLKEDRSLLTYIFLGIITFGIYDIVFMWGMVQDINTACDAKENDYAETSPNYLIVIIFAMLTCGIYYFFWLYKQGNRIQRVGEKYGIRVEESGTTYLLWNLVGVLLCFIGPYVGLYYMIKNVNSLCRSYNREYADGNAAYGSRDKKYGDNGNYDNRNANGGVGAIGQRNNAVAIGADYDAARATVGVQPGMIICEKGSMRGARIPLQDREVVTVGRDGTVCNLVLPEPDISRRHCTIQFISNKNCYYVTDHSSTGVVMNGGQRLGKNTLTECRRGSRLLLGTGSNELLLQ